MDLESAGFLAFFIITSLGFFAIPWWWARRVNARWRAVGDALGLQPVGAMPALALAGDGRALRGEVQGQVVQLRIFTIGMGRSRTTYSGIELPLPDVDPGFTLRMTREGLGERIAKRLGGADLETGNPDFDAALRVQTSDEARARRVLDAMSQQALLALPAFAEVRVAACVEMPDGAFLDAPEALKGWYTSVGGAPGLDVGPYGKAQVAVLRWSRTGAGRLTEDEARTALPLLVQLTQAVRAAAPRQ